MINVTHFGEHSIEMYAVDSCPCKCSEPRVVKTYRDELTRELKVKNILIEIYDVHDNVAKK